MSALLGRLQSMSIDRLLLNFEKAFGLVGIGIIFWMVHRLGPARIAENLHMVNWGFLLMVLSKSLRFLLQAVSWKLILAQEKKHIPFWKLFKINLEGEALNYITVTRVGGEPLKAISIKDSDNLSLSQSAASVIVLKFCIVFGFWLAIAGGFLAILLSTDVTGDIKNRIGLGMILLTAAILFISWIPRQGLFSPLSWVLRQFQSKRDWVSHQVVRLTHLDEQILETYHSRQVRILASALLNALAWLEEIFFIWLALRFLNIREGWLLPTLIATMSQLMNSFFFFVPWRAGTQEGTMVLTFSLLSLSEPVGLSLAILRRMRELVWTFFGLVVFSLDSLPSSIPEAATK